MIKFLHFNNPYFKKTSQRLKRKFQSRTVAIESVQPHIIRTLARDFIDVYPDGQVLMYQLKIGVTVLHPDDRYSKKIGRETALVKMEDVPLRVVGAIVTSTHIFVELQTFKGMDLKLRLNKVTEFSTVTGSMSGDQ